MAGKKKFGAFEGVFTPSILTILGVIMYLRLGWVVGNAGLIGTIIIILIAHVIAVSTGLSVSSVATDKKIGAGGIYYVLSRSMGIPIGGSIGIALYVGTALSIALYLVGFAESFNGYFGLETAINDIRTTGTIALLALTAIALISTSVALKAQFFILAAIIISLISIFFGTSEHVPAVVTMFSDEGSVPLEIVFAVFFPAVTGFTAGIAMSGDLKDPKKAIPTGTLFAIGVGLIVYVGLAVFIAYSVDTDVLRSDNNILMKIALFAPAVVAGIWGATLSSALGGILGGPRILQAMSVDSVTPKFFGRGRGKNNEPVNALLLVFIIAEAGILIGELDVIARVVSMFYLTAYGFINISYFLESWANPDFQPTFKIKRWIGLVGFIACFGVMFKLDMIAMFAAFGVVGMLYFWLQRKQIQLQSNDVWQSVWSNIVNKGLRKLEAKESNKPNWNPNIILFTTRGRQRPQMLELSKSISGKTGVVTDFKLIISNGENAISKTEQTYRDEDLDKLGIYGRQVEVDDSFSGIENIASTYGFTGIEPNTIMMNWSRTRKDPEKFSKMTQKLIHLDYNLLYLDYDEVTEFGKYKTIDLWWRETDGNNAEMMLNISRYLSQSTEWSSAKIRVLYVNHNNSDNVLIKSKIANLLEKLRIDAEIKIINNGVEQKSFYKIIELQSPNTDLIVLGVPNINSEKQAKFILNTDQLFEVVGSTLLVKASNNFNSIELDVDYNEEMNLTVKSKLPPLDMSPHQEINDAVYALSDLLDSTSSEFNKSSLITMSSFYYQFVDNIRDLFNSVSEQLVINLSSHKVIGELESLLKSIADLSFEFSQSKLAEIEDVLKQGIDTLEKNRNEYLIDVNSKVSFNNESGQKEIIEFNDTVDLLLDIMIVPNLDKSLRSFGVVNFLILNDISNGIREEVDLFVEKLVRGEEDSFKIYNNFTSSIYSLLESVQGNCLLLAGNTISQINVFERKLCNELVRNIEDKQFYLNLKKKKRKNRKERKKINSKSNITTFSHDWRRNQQLAHNQFQADLRLAKTGLSVLNVNELIKERINSTTAQVLLEDLLSVEGTIDYMIVHLGDEELVNHRNETIDKHSQGVTHLDINRILNNEEDMILSVSAEGGGIVSLMTSESFNKLDICQNEDVEDLRVDLSKVQNYIIRNTYLNPLQESIHNVEDVIQSTSNELYHTTSLINHILHEKITKSNKSTYMRSLLESREEIDQRKDVLLKFIKNFEYDLNVLVHNVLVGLNVRTIIESIDSFMKDSLKPQKESGFSKWIKARKATIDQAYTNVHDFIIQKQRDVDNTRYLEENKEYKSNIEQVKEFVDSVTLDKRVESKVSFYYKKLFSGSHLGSLNSTYSNNDIIQARKAISRMESGISGAIMILGEPSSGKSFYLHSICTEYISSKKIYVTPPVKQEFTKNDIDRAIQKSFRMSGSAESILNDLNNKSIIIFSNLEQWWLKARNGSIAINYIIDLIEKYGSKHYFILSCNINSYAVIKLTTKIEGQLLSTIIVTPSSRLELGEILINRHKTAGGELWIKNDLILDSKHFDSVVNTLHNLSGGNVGAALRMWIRNIKLDDENQMYMSRASKIAFPDIDAPHWILIIYHLILHRKLKKKDFVRIFGDVSWLSEVLNSLVKSDLIGLIDKSTYMINDDALYYVRLWLIKKGILK